MNLTRFESNDIELLINQETGESFASISGYARISEKSKSTIHERIEKLVRENKILEAEIDTGYGVKLVRLVDEDLISLWLPKDNPEMATKLLKLGVRVFLHTLAGFQVTSTAMEKKPVSSIDLFELQVKILKEQQAEIDRIKLDQRELFEFKREIEQTRDEAIESLKGLTPPTIEAAPLTPRFRLNRLIRDYAFKKNLAMGSVWRILYREFRDRYHIDILLRAKSAQPKMSGCAWAEANGYTEFLYSIAHEVLV